jgi:hypothetical protein
MKAAQKNAGNCRFFPSFAARIHHRRSFGRRRLPIGAAAEPLAGAAPILIVPLLRSFLVARFPSFCRRRLHRLLASFALVVTAQADAARGQQTEPSVEFVDGLATITLAQSLDGDPALAAPLEATNDELFRRLMATEARLAEVEAQLQASQASSPADGASVAPVEIPDAPSFAEEAAEAEAEPEEEEDPEPKWYDKYTFRGYAQFRWNDVMDLEPGSAPAQHVGDRSVGDNQEFLIRRARLIFAGDISEHLYVYLQPDFAVTPPGSPDATHFGQIRDWYGDWYLDATKIHRLRVGQSKVPYGWENMQSSSNRLPLDRNDALNSAVRNERDLGIFYYWTPEADQEIFTWVNDQGLKGSNNYGTFGFGAYNGQGGSFLEQNDRLHIVSRFTYPFFLDNGQLLEFSMQGYMGDYVVLSTPISPLELGAPVRPAGTLETGERVGHRDERLA